MPGTWRRRSRGARAAEPALVGGAPGLAWARGAEPTVAFAFAIANGRVVGIELIADEERSPGARRHARVTGV